MKNLKLAVEIFSSKRRSAILKAFAKPMTPTQLAKTVKMFHPQITTNHCSDELRLFFVKKGLAKCVNPEVRRNRVYMLLESGEELRNILLKSNLANEV